MFFERNNTEKRVNTTNSHLQSEAISALGDRSGHRSGHQIHQPVNHGQNRTAEKHDHRPQKSAQHRSLKQSEPTDYDDGGKYAVQNGDTLWSIARHALLKQHTDSESAVQILQEIARITSLNADRYPDLEKDPHLIKVGMVLNISTKGETSAKNEHSPSHSEAVCAKSPLHVAEPGQILVVKNCERVVAGPGTYVIVEAGGQAYAHDATAIVFRGGQVLAHGGYVLGQTTSEQDEQVTNLRSVAHATRVATDTDVPAN